MIEELRLANGRTVVITVDDGDDFLTSVVDKGSGAEVGSFIFRLIEVEDSLEVLHLTLMALDEAGSGYTNQGVGRRILEMVKEFSGLSITAGDHDGSKRDDGSHLTGDGPKFVEAMRTRGLILKKGDATDAEDW